MIARRPGSVRGGLPVAGPPPPPAAARSSGVPLSREEASATLTWQCTSTVFTRRPATETSRRLAALAACWPGSASVLRLGKHKAADAPAIVLRNSLRLGIAPPESLGFARC